MSTTTLTRPIATRTRTGTRGRRTFRRYLAWQGTDVLLINLAFIASYLLRYRAGVGGEVFPQNDAPLSSYGWIELSYTAILMALLNIDGLYRSRRGAGLVDQWGIIFRSAVVAVAVISALAFMLRPYAFSRWIFIYMAVGAVVLLSIARMVASYFSRWRYQRGAGVTNLLVLGGTRIAKMIMQRVASEPGLGYHLVGFLADTHAGADWGRFKYLGRSSDLETIIRERQVDEVLVALPATSHRQILQAVKQCRAAGAEFAMVPDLLELRLSQVDMDAIGGIPLIGLRESSISGVNRVFKRAIDVVIASCALLVASPLIALIALAVKCDSPGSAFFGQVRVGKGGRQFRAWKFRSMTITAEQEQEQLLQRSALGDGIKFKDYNDPRRTRVGKWLRRTSLDELPQCWNVLKGEMSIVGPRPPVPREVQRYEEWHLARLQVAPGMTGLSQVSGRSLLNFDEMVMLDLYYIENWSPGLELKILLMTVPAVLSGRGAY